MLKLRVIPCLDVHQGRVVKGVNFVSLRDAGDPVEQAKIYDKAGADELTFLDITATSDNRHTMLDVISKTASQVHLPLTVGGGVRNCENIRNLLLHGADKCAINSAAVKTPELINQAAERFGSQCIVAAIDVRADGHGNWHVYVKGGRENTGIDALEWVRELTQRGAGEILLTSMDRDGTKSGFDLDLLKKVCNITHLPVVASGGVGQSKDFVTGAQAGATGLLAASVFHFGQITIHDVKLELNKAGLPVRLNR